MGKDWVRLFRDTSIVLRSQQFTSMSRWGQAAAYSNFLQSARNAPNSWRTGIG